MSIDGDLRKIFRDKLRAGYQWTSIESGLTIQGIPDAEFCSKGVARWVEFKKTDAWAVGLSKEQAAWHEIRHLRGGVSFVAIRRRHSGGVRKGKPEDQLWLFRGEWARVLRNDGLRSAAQPLIICDGGPERWDWDTISQHLLDTK